MLNNTQKKINASLKKIWLQSLSKLPHNSQKGQTFPPAIALGFIGMSAGALTLVNAGNEQQNIIAQQRASQAQNITEAGIAKSLSTFTQGNNQYLLLASYGQNGQNVWSSVTSSDLDLDGDNSYTDDIDINIANGCGEYNGTTQLKTNPDAMDFINNLVSNNTVISNIENAGVGSGSSAGTYAVKNYEFDKSNNQGKLIIQGQNSLNTQNKAQYQITFGVNTSTITPSTSSSVGAAALMSKDMNTKSMAIFANTIICTDPNTPGSCGNDVPISSSYCDDGVLSVDTSQDYYTLYNNNELEEYNLLETMMGSTNNGFRAPDNKMLTDIVISETVIPPISTAPVGYTIPTFDASTGSNIDLSQAPFSTSFVEENIDGELHHAIYIQLTDVATRAGDINFIINETALENIVVNGNNLDSEKLIVRAYIADNMIFNGNDAIQVYNSSNQRISGATEKERNQIASLRIIGGYADGTAVGNLSWDMTGTGCLMGHVHAPTVDLELPQGNGCGSSGGEVPIDINIVAQDNYGTGNVINIATNFTTPNSFGAIWAKNITNKSSGGSASFYENPALTKKLLAEFGSGFPGITGTGASSTSVQMSAGISSIVRQAVQ